MSNPLGNIGDLSKPATVLVEKISEAVGGIFRPYQIVRVAKAEAEVDRIRAESEIQITDVHRRALNRFLQEEAQKQLNIEAITQRSFPLLEEKASPDRVESDWIANFFDKCRIISDEEMQELWSRLLAGEANAPGSISKKTVNLLADLDKGDAILFTNLCTFVWQIRRPTPLIFDVQAPVYNARGINFVSLVHLETLGLVRFDNTSGFKQLGLPKGGIARYHGRPVVVTFPKDADNELDIGRVLLTQAGQELARVSSSSPDEGFFQYVYDIWAGQSLVPERSSAQPPKPESTSN
jgi:hypothetical protein